MSYEQLLTAFKHKNFQPLYFLYGEEQYLKDVLQQALVEHALAPHERDFNLDVLHGADTDVPQVLACCNAFPSMATHRIIIVRNFEKLTQLDLFTQYPKRPNPSSIVFLIHSTKPNFVQNPYRALKSHAVCLELKSLKNHQIPNWIQKYLEKENKSISPRATQMFLDTNGNDLQSLTSELSKLVTYVGERNKIEHTDILSVGGHAKEFNVFELQKAVSTADKKSAITIAEQMLQQQTNEAGEAIMITAVLASFFIKLWKLTECQQRGMTEQAMAVRIGVSPYFIKEYVQSLRHYTYPQIQQALQALLASDFELKGGSTRTPSTILTLLFERLIP